MRTEEREVRRARAISLRLAGYSRAQIAQVLGVKTGGRALDRWLRGVPAPAWTRRPRAKDDVRERAIQLRRQGRSYGQIQAELGVSRGSLSLWLRDVPLSEEQAHFLEERQRLALLKASTARHSSARFREKWLVNQARAQIGPISDGELFVAGVVAYWAEGAKTKPWGPREGVDFINSDPGMIRLFAAWLDLVGVSRDERSYRVSIYASADVKAAIRYWSDVVGVPADRFLRTTLKRHNPQTTRRNVGPDYRGCLRISVQRSTDLNSRIRGWFEGIVQHSGELSSGGSLSAEF